MKTYEATGKNYEEALQNGLNALHATISDVTVETLEEGSKGLFGLFGSKPCKLRLTLHEVEEEVEEDDPLADLLSSVKVEAPKPAAQPKPQPKPVQPKPQPKPHPKPAQPKPAQEKPAEVKVEAKVEAPAEAPAVEAAPAVTDAAPAADAAERPAPVQRKRNDRPKKDKPRQPKAEGESAPKPERKPLPPKAPAAPLEKPVVTMIPDEQIDPASPVGQAQSFLKELTHLMGVDVTVAMGTDAENNIFAQMTGDTLGILIGRRGETLDALQYLTSLRINKGQDHYTRVTLDTENYRAKREDTLIRLANRMANRAVKTGRKVSLEPMNPYDRRIIHAAVAGVEGAASTSIGEEPNRRVVISSLNSRGPRQDRRGGHGGRGRRSSHSGDRRRDSRPVENTAVNAEKSTASKAPLKEAEDKPLYGKIEL